MDFAAIKTRAALLSSFGGFTDTSSAPNWTTLVNEAQEYFAWDTEFLRETVASAITTVAEQQEYTLAAPYFKVITEAIYDTASAKTPLEIVPEWQERRWDSRWTTQSSGTPQQIVVVKPNVFWLVPKPDTSSKVISLRGVRTPAAMSADGDTPAIPARFHEALAYKAAILQMEPFAKGEERERLNYYQEQYDRLVAQCRTYLSQIRHMQLQRRVSHTSGRGRIRFRG